MVKPPKASNTQVNEMLRRVPPRLPPKGSSEVRVSKSVAPPKPVITPGSSKTTTRPTAEDKIASIARAGQSKLKDVNRAADPKPTHTRKV